MLSPSYKMLNYDKFDRSRQGHQVQIFKMSIFEFLCTVKAFGASWDAKIRSRSPKVIKCYFSSSYAQKKHFGHHGRSKSGKGQGHQRSSSVNFQKIYIFELLCTETQIQVKVTNGDQVHRQFGLNIYIY